MSFWNWSVSTAPFSSAPLASGMLRARAALAFATQLYAGTDAWVPSCLWEENALTPECLGSLPRIKSYYEQQRGISMLWTAGSDHAEHAGLGGGITWAWDDQLCDDLLPQFNEDLWFAPLVTCGSLRAAMTRAFASWAAHHPLINFHDVTNECDAYPLGHPLSQLYLTHPTETDDNLGRGCLAAEVYVTSRSSVTSAATELAASATTRRVRTEASCCSASDTSCCFRSTNGVALDHHYPVYDTRRASLAFDTSLCWYLDSTFCSFFHRLKAVMGADEAHMLGRLLVFGLWAVVLLETVSTLYTLFQRHYRAARLEAASHTDNFSDEAFALYEYTMAKLAHACSACSMTVRGVLLIAPLLFYTQIFAPCWDCFDFEAGATHEIGHLLGLM